MLTYRVNRLHACQYHYTKFQAIWLLLPNGDGVCIYQALFC